jgi:hypothetical protein
VRAWLVPARDAAGATYGTITIGALLAAERPRAETFARTIGGAVLALVLVWAAHTYAAVLGHRLSESKTDAPPAPLSADRLGTLIRDEVAVLKGGVVPVLALLLAWVAGASLGTAITVTVYACAGTLVAAELLAGVRAHLAIPALILQTAFGACLGIAVLALNAIIK